MLLETYITRKDFAHGIMWSLQYALAAVISIVYLFTGINLTSLVSVIYALRFNKLLLNDNVSLDNFIEYEFTRRKEDLKKIRKYLEDHSGGISIKEAKELLGTVKYLIAHQNSNEQSTTRVK